MGKLALKDLPLQEITLRKYELPANDLGGIEDKNRYAEGLQPATNEATVRYAARKFLLSIGLLQPGESRDVLVDVFYELLLARTRQKLLEIRDFEQKLAGTAGASSPNLHRQLRRLKEIKLVEKWGNGYRIPEFGCVASSIEFIEKFIVNETIERIKQYASLLDSGLSSSA